jgi:hypothetical protein
MDETMKNSTEELNDNTSSTEDDALKAAIEEQLSKIRRQSMLLGGQVMLHTVLDKIVTAMNKPGKRSLNDYRRLVKDIESFCRIGLSRKVNENGETELVEESTTEETVQD